MCPGRERRGVCACVRACARVCVLGRTGSRKKKKKKILDPVRPSTHKQCFLHTQKRRHARVRTRADPRRQLPGALGGRACACGGGAGTVSRVVAGCGGLAAAAGCPPPPPPPPPDTPSRYPSANEKTASRYAAARDRNRYCRPGRKASAPRTAARAAAAAASVGVDSGEGRGGDGLSTGDAVPAPGSSLPRPAASSSTAWVRQLSR